MSAAAEPARRLPSPAGASGGLPVRSAPLGGGWATPATAFLVAFFVAPLAYVSMLALVRRAPDAAWWDPYLRFGGDAFYRGVLVETVVVGFAVAALSVLIAYPVAIFYVRHAGRWRSLCTFLLVAPLLTSIVMRTYGWRVLLSSNGLVNSVLKGLGVIERPLDFLNGPVIVVVAMVHVLVPFAVLSVASSIQAIDRRVEEVAAMLGARPMRVFIRITVPLSREGALTGFIFVFMIAIGTFITPLLLGGGSVQTLSLLIYQQFTQTRDIAFAAALGNVLLLCALVCLYLQMRVPRLR